MAMNIHQEARRKQVFMDRVCEARRRMAFSQDDAPQASGSCGGQRDSEKVMCTDQGQFYQTRSCHTWTGPERNRRAYDRSREGPKLGQSWRALEREMNFRENSLSSSVYQSQMPGMGFQPVDAAFPRK
ncbi:uncharacterized protein LOC101850851 isoform X2 [Aplysia californica]|uniref:Uncharacterized protein LOC101850851 isoform X2 n=1 Tax=Aplysia californica TaxID=6500 RepID=A0ABM0K6S9_APLCA|nr:uncharacterized protein LOC101850851 isoform X2 [Aplysia californica]